MTSDATALATTPLHALHQRLEARFTAFAGYEMPVQYPLGVLREHLHVREKAGLFDVSHMGQIALRPRSGDLADAARALEALTPADVVGLPAGRQRYALLTNGAGGILDDMMVANRGGSLLLVVNAARKAADLAHLSAHLETACDVEMLADRALIALQGPGAEAALNRLAPSLAASRFMDVRQARLLGADCLVSRSGYTGEDGFEVSVPAAAAEAVAEALLADPEVAPIGLGARDSLRLEAGLCLYGADLTEETTPIEADLIWSIGKARRPGGARSGGFLGAETILAQLAEPPARRRICLRPEGRAPMRAGTTLFVGAEGGTAIGAVTSGGFGPSVSAPVAMGYVEAAHAAAGAELFGEVRGKRLPARIETGPFAPHRYKRR